MSRSTRIHDQTTTDGAAGAGADEHDLGELALPDLPDPSPATLARLVQLIGLRPELWSAKVGFDPETRYYARLGRTDTYEVWLLTWLPGQTTDLHDHGESSAGFTVVAGLLRERTVHRLTNGLDALRERHLPPGSVRAVAPGTRHEVLASSTPAVSIHAYSPGLAEMPRFVLHDGRLRSVDGAPGLVRLPLAEGSWDQVPARSRGTGAP